MAKLKSLSDLGGLVYSTNPDFVVEEVEAEPETELSPNKQNLRITLDKIKGNKRVTRIYQFVGNEEKLAELAKLLKNKCACGGGVKEGEILLQGDFVAKVKVELEKLGYKYKVVGG